MSYCSVEIYLLSTIFADHDRHVCIILLKILTLRVLASSAIIAQTRSVFSQWVVSYMTAFEVILQCPG